MAFKDANGRITIDEVAAQKDVANIQAAIRDLQAARDSLNEIMCQAQSFSGRTANSMVEYSARLLKEYDVLISKLEESASLIQQTIDKYQKIDENVRNIINNQG